ncbi:MAG: hypothetical protein ABI358_09325 [Ginsengibacter sp.]
MELLSVTNTPPIFIFHGMDEATICTSSKNNFQNPNLILKAYAIKEMAGSISLRYEKFLQKTMLVKKTGVLTKKRKGA